MSFLPAPFVSRENSGGEAATGRTPVVYISGNMAVAEQRWHQFSSAYHRYVDADGRHTVHRSPTRRFTFPNGDTMRIISQGDADFIWITVVDGDSKHTIPSEGFVVVPVDADDQSNPDKKLTRVYQFGFDKSEFASSVVPDFEAGNLRREVENDGYVSWDGTGGGDMAHEIEPVPEYGSTALHNPNAYAKPYAALSGNLYSAGEKYAVLDGLIHGMRASGDTILLADYSADRTVRIHRAFVSRDADGEISNISYGSVLGTAPVEVKGLVNFSADLKSCVILSTVVAIEEPFAADHVFRTTRIIPEGTDKVVRVGYKVNDLNFTLTKTINTGGMTNFCPHDFAEYTLPWDSNPAPIDTYGHRTEVRNYFEVAYKLNWTVGESPNWSRSYDQSRHCAVLKKPIIVFQGYMPTTVYTWMRTVSQLKITDENKLYWYKDYDADDFVRCAWFIGYVATQTYSQYGLENVSESDVVTGRALTVGGTELVTDAEGKVSRVSWANVIENGMTSRNWFYAVTNSAGDFILRQAPNGEKSDALLVSRKGVTKLVKDTYSVGIF